MSEALFSDLIVLLQKVKTPKQVDNQLVDELLNAGIASAVAMVQEKDNCSYTEALEVARMTVLKHFDMLLQEADRMGMNDN